MVVSELMWAGFVIDLSIYEKFVVYTRRRRSRFLTPYSRADDYPSTRKTKTKTARAGGPG